MNHQHGNGRGSARDPRAWALFVLLSCASASVVAQTFVFPKATTDVGAPQLNTAVGNARVMLPDGTSLFQSISALQTLWFTFGVEPGKTYTVEILDPFGDLGNNRIGSVAVTDSTGAAAPPEASVSCSIGTPALGRRSPSLESTAAADGRDGVRCIIITNSPAPGAAQNKRGIFIGISDVPGGSFQLRVRESTMYSRWSTTGYEYHVELQNTTADAMCAQAVLYPEGGFTFPFASSPAAFQLSVPGYGAVKTVVPNGTPVAGITRGTIRIQGCPSQPDFVADALHVTTYSYNPITDKFLYFFARQSNGGSSGSSW